MKLLKRILRLFSKHFLIFIGITAVVELVIFYFFILSRSRRSAGRVFEMWLDIVPNVVTHPIFWFLVLAPYLLYRLVKSLIDNYRKAGWKGLGKGMVFKIALPVFIFFGISFGLKHYRNGETFEYTPDISVQNTTPQVRNLYETDGKQRGMHIFGFSNQLGDIAKLKTNNFEWITVTPFIYQERYNKPQLNVPTPERFVELEEHYRALKATCDSMGIRIMMKPHIWLRENSTGKWRSNIGMKTEAEWDTWFQNYEDVILGYAQISENLGFQQFCIGTELETTAKEHPERWRDLIAKTRTIFSGTLVYAANWNEEYQNVTFWDDLDYIGIQAYFPIGKGTSLNTEKFTEAWEPYKTEIKKVSDAFNKPVIFTEMGYRSLSGTSKTPWEWAGLSHQFMRISKKEQYICYEAFFNAMWDEPWFHGLHIWEWQGRMKDGENTSFTVEYKPALNLIARKFIGE